MTINQLDNFVPHKKYVYFLLWVGRKSVKNFTIFFRRPRLPMKIFQISKDVKVNI